MAKTQLVESVCGLCFTGCGVAITMKDGKPVDIKGDPGHPLNKGRLCQIGLSSLEYLYHPDRLKRPLKRVGGRGKGNWREIPWDEALNVTAEALNDVKQKYGPESVLMAHGSAKGMMDTHLVRLANAFGTPNVVCSDHVCMVPKLLGAEFTFGFFPGAEYWHPPACIISWGANRAATRFTMHESQVQAVNKGTKLIVIDPLRIELANMADLWLQIRPGTDLALALGMIKVIISEGLYDKDFVDRWTIGFDELKTHVQNYSPERVAEITWVPAELIVKGARLYATNRPSHIDWGNAVDQTVNSFQTCRALAILMAITGNIGIPGGEVERPSIGFRYSDTELSNHVRGRWSYKLELRDNIPREKRPNKVGADLTLLPDFRYVIPQSVMRSILEGQPYPIHAAYVQASNPLSCWPNTRKAYQALKKLDFLAVSDMFMTPTAALADIVFPVASYLEYDGMQIRQDGTFAWPQRKVDTIGECRSDHEIINGLAKELGLGEYFWDSIDDFWDAVLKPAGLTYKKFKKVGRFATTEKQPQQYKMYEKDGFETPSGKVELYSSQLQNWGIDPLPVYYEPPGTSYSNPELARKYPLYCTTRKIPVYRHSGGRQIPSLRHSHPEPVIIIHPETASQLGIKDGNWVYIESKWGRIKQKANLSTNVDPRVVVADYGWWFPQREKGELFGWDQSNYNVLTSDEPPFNREIGSFIIRGLACKVYKVPVERAEGTKPS